VTQSFVRLTMPQHYAIPISDPWIPSSVIIGNFRSKTEQSECSASRVQLQKWVGTVIDVGVLVLGCLYCMYIQELGCHSHQAQVHPADPGFAALSAGMINELPDCPSAELHESDETRSLSSPYSHCSR
jgi:hypothetical protein